MHRGLGPGYSGDTNLFLKGRALLVPSFSSSDLLTLERQTEKTRLGQACHVCPSTTRRHIKLRVRRIDVDCRPAVSGQRTQFNEKTFLLKTVRRYDFSPGIMAIFPKRTDGVFRCRPSWPINLPTIMVSSPTPMSSSRISWGVTNCSKPTLMKGVSSSRRFTGSTARSSPSGWKVQSSGTVLKPPTEPSIRLSRMTGVNELATTCRLVTTYIWQRFLSCFEPDMHKKTAATNLSSRRSIVYARIDVDNVLSVAVGNSWHN